MKYPNFYENIDEARNRLVNSIVLYKGIPGFIRFILPHSDGIFRVYLEMLPEREKKPLAPWIYNAQNSHMTNDTQALIDQTVDNDGALVRKMMSSRHFNNFRPFPLGMLNDEDAAKTSYVMRSPTRGRSQGLKFNMIRKKALEIIPQNNSPLPSGNPDDYLTSSFRKCIMGEYPTFSDCYDNLSDPDVINSACAFDREFAVIRGPVGMLFLGYQRHVVGVFDNKENVTLSAQSSHLAELLGELNLFKISIK